MSQPKSTQKESTSKASTTPTSKSSSQTDFHAQFMQSLQTADFLNFLANAIAQAIQKDQMETAAFVHAEEQKLKEQLEGEIVQLKHEEDETANKEAKLEQDTKNFADSASQVVADQIKEIQNLSKEFNSMKLQLAQLNQQMKQPADKPTVDIEKTIRVYLKDIILDPETAERQIQAKTLGYILKNPSFQSAYVISGTQDKQQIQKLLNIQRHFIAQGVPYNRWAQNIHPYLNGDLGQAFLAQEASKPPGIELTWYDIAVMFATVCDLPAIDRALWLDFIALAPVAGQPLGSYLTKAQTAATKLAEFPHKYIVIRNIVYGHLEKKLRYMLQPSSLQESKDLSSFFSQLQAIFLNVTYPSSPNLDISVNRIDYSHPRPPPYNDYGNSQYLSNYTSTGSQNAISSNYRSRNYSANPSTQYNQQKRKGKPIDVRPNRLRKPKFLHAIDTDSTAVEPNGDPTSDYDDDEYFIQDPELSNAEDTASVDLQYADQHSFDDAGDYSNETARHTFADANSQ